MSAGDFVAALDVGGTKVALATAATDGRVLEHSRIETRPERGARQALRRTLDATRAMVERTASSTGGRCLAAGAVCPGIPLEDRVLLSPNVPGWDRLAFEREVCGALGLECVAVRNDVKAAGLAEARWGALAGADPAVFLSLGTGIAAAILIAGRLLDGAHGASGELAYVRRGADDRQSYADGHAPLEELAGGRFIGERASALAGRPLTAAEAFAAEDAPVVALVDRTLDELAVQVANVATLIDPERIAVGGGLMASADRVLAALRGELERAVPFPPALVPARFVHDGALRGAVALALDAVA